MATNLAAFSVPNGVAAAEVVQVAPGTDIQSVVNAYPPGTEFVLQAGVHRMQQVAPKDDQLFRGEPGAILNGSRVLTGWVPDASRWYVTGQTQEGPTQGLCDPGYERCVRPEELFVDNVALRHVTSLGALGVGSWFFDYGADRIYLGEDPAGKLVETSVTSRAFFGPVDGVQVRHLVVEKYANVAQTGAIDGSAGVNWLVDGVEARLNHGSGIHLASGGVIRNSFVHHNGQQGFSANGNGIVVEDTEISFNNTARFSLDWEGGGNKLIGTDLTIRRNYSHDNYGPGIWIDINSFNVVIEDNVVERNFRAGIFFEVSNTAFIRGNYSEGNGLDDLRAAAWLWSSGILVASSLNAEVHNNVVVNNGNGITATQQDRGSGPWGVRRVENLTVHDNIVTMAPDTTPPNTLGLTGAVQDLGDNAIFTSRNNEFRNNTYRAGPATNRFAWFNGSHTFTSWQSYGHDVTGSITGITATPPTWSGSLSPSAETPTTITLSWAGASDPDGVGAYRIYEATLGQVAATAGATSATVRFLQPETTYSFTVEAVDTMGNESTDGPSVAAVTDSGGSGALPLVSVTATDATEAGSVDGVFTVSRTGPTTDALSVLVDLGGSTATAPPEVNEDYTTLVPNPVVVPAGQSSVQVLVDPVDDTLVEGDETVVLGIVANPQYLIGHPAATTMTIADDDGVSVPETFTAQIAAGSDDAEELVDGHVSVGSSDLEFVLDRGGDQTVGMRWIGVDVPQGAVVTDAWVQFQVDEVNTAATDLLIVGQAGNNAATFSSASFSISSRPRTEASVGWVPVPWTSVGARGVDQRTPDLSAVVQEIVDRSGWVTGNALALIVTGTGERTAESFNGSAGASAELHIEFETGPVANRPPVANPDGATTQEVTTVPIDVVANDTDPDGNLVPSSANATAGPSDGSLVNNGDGTFDYTPNLGFVGGDSFTYEVCDSEPLCDTALVSITVMATNDPPVANDDLVVTPEDTAILIDVVANDTDPDDNLVPSSAVATAGPTSGALVNNGDGTLSYTPDAEFSGADGFTYEVCDSGSLCDTAVVSIDVTFVNDPPVALDDVAATTVDTAVMIDVVANDTDPDGNLVLASASTVSGPSDGVLVNNGDGTFDYTPNVGLIGADSFTYEVCDVEPLCDTGLVSITVTGGMPTTFIAEIAAGSDDAEQRGNGSVSLASSDIEMVFDSSSNQTVGLRWGGVDVPQGVVITDAWVQFQVDETNSVATNLMIQGQAADDAATFTSTSSSISTRPRTGASVGWVPVPWTSVGERGADQRTPDLSGVIQEIVDRPGWVTGNALALIVTGTGERTAESYDGSSNAPAEIHIEYLDVPVPNRPPVAVDDAAATVVDTSVTVDVVANDTDADGNLVPSSASAVSGSSDGSLVNNGDGTFTYTPNGGFIGGDGFVYEVCDVEPLCDTALVLITVTAGAPATFGAEIAAGSDDAEELGDGHVSVGSSDLEFVADRNSNQEVGMRWVGVSIPQGAVVTDAWVQFQVDEANTVATDLLIAGQAGDNAATFTSASFNISSRLRTGASVPWVPVPWTSVGERGADQRTPDLSGVIQEIVDRPGWVSGNALALIVTGTGERTAESYDGSSNSPAELHIQYIAP